MTTKEQERKALAQIRKIVEGLGEDSYVGTAFEGCFEKAEANINDDAAYSWKSDAEYWRALAHDERAKLTDLQEELEEAKEQVNEANRWQTFEKQRADDWYKSYCELSEVNNEKVKTIETLQGQIEAKDLEIIKLKARLFDLLDK